MSDERLPELFEELADLAAEQRDRRLAELAANEPHLAAELGRLLAAADSESTPLERSPRPSRTDETDDAPAAPVPARVGPYRIERELGRGGMGRVFLAEQEGDGFRRRVALKVVAGLGASEEDRRRLREEWRILAGLEHPGIARFYDAGETRDGALYLALEFVDGDGLVAHAEAHGLGVEERLALFLQVLDAVAFAHSRGVVHRDLKPANILVGSDGRVRLVDFGISKLLEADTDPSALTRTGRQHLTPAYAAPEQILGRTAGPAADLYSLGVVLYELLSGRRPQRDSTGGPGEIGRAVPDRQPEPPGGVARPARESRGAETPPPPLAAPGLDRDLDAICRKALREEPSARYPSAGAFAEDLRRHLEGRPVSARGGEPGYRLLRLLVRHRIALVAAAAAAAIAAMVAVLAIRRPGPSTEPPVAGVSRDLPGELPAKLERRNLAAGAASGLPPSDADIGQLRRLFAATPGRAEAELARSVDDAERVADAAALARDLNDLAIEVLRRGDLDRGEALLARALEVSRDARADGGGRGRSRDAALLANLGEVARRRGRPDLAEARFREAVAIDRELGSPRQVGADLVGLSQALRDQGRAGEAAGPLDEAVALLRAAGDDAGVAVALFHRADAAVDLGRLDGVEAAAGEIVIAARASGDPKVHAFAGILQGRAAAASGDSFAGLRRLDEALGRLAAGGDLDLAAAVELLAAEIAFDSGLLADAAGRAERALATCARATRSEVATRAGALLARVDARAGRSAEAARRLAGIDPGAAQGPSVRERLAVRRARAALELARGRSSAARAELASALGDARAAGRELDAGAIVRDLELAGSAVPRDGVRR